MTTIAVFVSSLVIMSMLLVMKAIELKYGKRNFLLTTLGKLDGKSSQFIAMLELRLLQLIQSVRYLVLIQSKAVCRNLLDKIETKIMEEYKLKQSAIIMGRKNITHNGSVSFYLKKITEDKGRVKGKIEESL